MLWLKRWKSGGGGAHKPTLTTKLRLNTLDERTLPSAYTPTLPASPPPQAGDPPVTTTVAVAQMANTEGTPSDIYLLVEQSVVGYTVQFYDGGTNVIYSGTSTNIGAFTLPPNPAIGAAFTQVSVAAALTDFRFEQADGSLTPASSTQAGFPPLVVANFLAAPPTPGATDFLIGPFTWNPPQPPPGSGSGGSTTPPWATPPSGVKLRYPIAVRFDNLWDTFDIKIGVTPTVGFPNNFPSTGNWNRGFTAGIELRF